MNDTRLKLRILAVMLREAYDAWRASYWERDLDSNYCCNGHECGCQGSSIRDVWTWEMTR